MRRWTLRTTTRERGIALATDLLTFTTDNLGRIRLDMLPPSPVAPGVLNECCCRNQHKPYEINGASYISTDPACKFHGIKSQAPCVSAEVEHWENLIADRELIMANRKKAKK